MLLRSVPLMLLVASSAQGQSDSVPPVRVFLFAGQSNMVGADTRPEIVDDYPPFVGAMQPQDDVRYAYSVGRSASDGWTHLQPVDDDFGPEVTFARRVKGRLDGPIAILKCAVGGTTIATDWHPDSPPEGQQLFQRLITLVGENLGALERDGVAYQVEALFWHQGENDMLSRELNPLYESGLKHFVARVRAELELPDLRVFVGEVSDKGIWGMDFRRPMRELRAQQRRVIEADPRMWWVPTSHLAFEVMGSGQPHYHFGTQGQLQHGEAYAEAYLDVIGTTPPRAPEETPTIPERGTRVRVFLVAGQRNMEGEDSFVEQLPDRWREPQRDVLMRCSLGGGAYRSMTWEALRPVDHLGNFGPELSFGHVVDEALDEPVAILKFTDSAAQISDWVPESEDASRPRYERLLAFVREGLADLESRGLRPSLDAVIWHHGENETWYAPFRRRYPALLQELITGLRRDLDRPELPWILAEQSTRAPWGEERIAEMNAGLATLAAADPHVHLVPTSDLPHGRIHFGTEGSLRLGERLARAWSTAAKEAAQDGFHYEAVTFLDLHEERSAGVQLGDIDGDGDLDIVIANGRHWPGQNRIFVNNGRAEFTVSRDLGTDRSTSYATPLADLDGDGDLDIAVGNDDAPSRVFWNDGRGRFQAGPTIGVPANTRSINLADLDGDGAIDIIVANRRQQNSIFFGDDSGSFARREGFGALDGSTIVIAVGDLDADGHIDLVEANRDGQPNFAYLNDGSGRFDEPVGYGTESDQTVAVALGDLDGDGHLDILNANSGQSNAIYFGDGSGQFVRSATFGPPEDLSYGLAVIDLDGDGDLDVVVANRGQRNGVYLNSGNGTAFRELRFGEAEALTYGVAAADLDGDGIPELVTANSDGRNWLFRRVPGRE